ncbi:hypothetical protein EGM70_10960 [Enterobacteriaceae bacterium 89]|nr:hypothetical protein [Enterobacteriaceae bacterium 89]
MMSVIKSAAACFALLTIPFFSLAQSPPNIGSTPADSHILCGKNITVEIQHAGGNYLAIGLTNHQTGDLDLFLSENPVNEDVSLNRFMPVKFDALSGKLVRQEESHMEVLWGKEQVNGAKAGYRLILGSHVYECGTLTVWPDESANTAYGEDQENTADKQDAQ